MNYRLSCFRNAPCLWLRRDVFCLSHSASPAQLDVHEEERTEYSSFCFVPLCLSRFRPLPSTLSLRLVVTDIAALRCRLLCAALPSARSLLLETDSPRYVARSLKLLTKKNR